MLAPIIVIGLGGVGSEVVARLENKVYEKKLSGKVVFASVDTDINTMNRIEQNGFEGCMVQISKNMTVKEYLSKNKEYESWFRAAEGLNIKSMTEGAGQVRAISRLAFDMAVRNGAFKDLEEKISRLFQVSDFEGHLTPRILIISSLAGGTGSGIILPLAFYMRKYFEEVLHIGTVIIKGMFIMPDVFRDIIGNEYERISIEANAYAALKELEAFIKKGEGYLPKNYADKLHLKMPVVASDKSEEYSTLPYNYCYLFGGKNESGGSLKSFQAYLDYTVECIYAQAFSPMQELNNSIEDNVFRIASTGIGKGSKGGFKRFCSSGTAVLNYPYGKILEFLSLKKAERILSQQWSVIDNEYFQDCQRNEELRKKGKYAKNQIRGEFYVDYVNSHKAESSLIKKIYTDTLTEVYVDENEIIQKESWSEYWAALEKDAVEWLADAGYLKKMFSSVEATLKFAKENNYHRKGSTFLKLKDHYDDLVRQAKGELLRKTSSAGIKYFGTRLEEAVNDKTYYQFWLKKNEAYIHPNAIRFFLYNAIAMFERKCEELKKLVAEEEIALQGSLDRTSDKINLTESFIWNEIIHKSDMNRMLGKIEEGLKILELYQKHVLLEQIAEKGCEFFKKLVKQYEYFYEVFDYNVRQYVERAENLKQELQDIDGTVMRYVCCDNKSLEYMESSVIDVKNDVEVSSEVSEFILNIIRDNAVERNKMDNYHEVFQERLIAYWKNEIKEEYGYLLDLDILDALNMESRCNAVSMGKAETYALNRIHKMWSIAEPFVGISKGTMELSKNFCTYSILLEGRKDYVRNQVVKMLKDSGGTADKEGAIDKYTIVFYQVVYALSPASLEEMSAEWIEKEEKFYKGTICKSYYQMLDNMKYSQITPHIDWNWNRFDILPDFNTEYQEHLESIVYQEFLYECAQDLKKVKQDETEKYCLYIEGDSIYETTLQKIFIDYFISDSSQVVERYQTLKKTIKQRIREGKTKDEFRFIKTRNSWGTEIGGIFGIIYHVNMDGGINEYDKTLLRKMVHAFIDLLWDILKEFESEEKRKASIREIISEECNNFSTKESEKINVRVQQDMKYALNEKLQQKDIGFIWQ